ncbi:MAG: DNA polymerase III subunit gamma/tau [Proteobacteria bacterium]|nr:DNA polymerase III subunit gamma/tau [Pseudomonadota bacterium]
MDGPGLFGGSDGGAPASGGYVVLARKYRPQTFDDLIGQEAMVTTLRNAFATERIAQAYMLTGVRGVGKTTTARILARALNYTLPGVADKPTIDLKEPGRHCKEIIESRHPDVVEMDAASNTGVDNMREIIESARYKPMVARYKVFIIDEVHMLSKGAFNALLKTLEEPPPHVKFIFATTEIRKVPVTVLSRCQRFDLRRVDVPLLAEHFRKIVAKENAEAEPEALALIARAAEGSVRDGLSVLDQAIAMGSGKVTEPGVRAMLGLADRGRLFDLLEMLFRGDAGAALGQLGSLHRDGADPLQTLADLGEAVHIATRVRVAGEDAAGEGLSAEEKRRATALAKTVSTPVLSRAWQMLLKGLEEASRAPSALSAAEMVLIRIAHAADLPSPEDIIRTLGGGVPARRGSAGDASRPAAESSGRGPLNKLKEVTPPTASAGMADEPPPPDSIEDYGAADPFDEDRESDEETGVAIAAPLVFDDPKSFEEVVAVVTKRRDARLMVHLEEHVSLVKFDATGSIEMALLPGAPHEIANELREKLNKWTGRRWMVAVSRSTGEPTLGEVRRAREAAELETLKSHPALSELLARFPDARITAVKPLSVTTDDEDEQAAG